jgi:hypothetical protein
VIQQAGQKQSMFLQSCLAGGNPDVNLLGTCRNYK